MATTKQGTQVTMPKLGESVTEGTIVGWLKSVGDRVEKYDPMVEVVTDKVNAEVPAPVSGTLVEIITGEGDVVPVGEVIAVIAEDGAAGASAGPVDETGAGSGVEEALEGEEVDRTVVMSAARIDDMQPAGEMLTSEPPAGIHAPATNGRSRDRDQALREAREARDAEAMLRIRSSPLVRRLAEEYEIDLAEVKGSGIGGRVTKSDIEAHIRTLTERPPRPAEPAAPPREPAPARPPSPPAPAIEVWPGDEVIEATPMRRQIAEHMVRSVQTAPHVTTWMEVDMSEVVAFREAHKAAFEEREGFSLSYVPLVLSVVVDALREHPDVNAVWDNGRIIKRRAINIGMAVALEGGLVVPVLKNADELNLTGLARAANDLVSRARAGQLTPDDVSGGTFTLNNPGALGSVASTPILVQPQAAILSMEAIVRRPVVVGDMIGIRPMMNLSMSIDHRILDGLAATRFLASVKRRLEEFPQDASI